MPQRLEPLLGVVGSIRAEAARRGVLQVRVDCGETAAELLDEARWRAQWQAEHRRRTDAVRIGAQRQLARQALEGEERRARRAALADRLRPVLWWSQQRLGVHPAIPGLRAVSTGFILPTFVPRSHDTRLSDVVSAACEAGSRPEFVLLTGRSCTGKTRSACEALAGVPDDFDLMFPADADSLLAALAADALGPRTVLWLNEAHRYLDGTAGDAVAAALLRRLDGDGPFLVMATMWPDQVEALISRDMGPEGDNPHRNAVELFRQITRIDLPLSFGQDLDAVQRAAQTDVSLAAALDTDGENLTQVLAAGPDMVLHYEQPTGEHGIYGSAVIRAAMDAHRLGLSVLPKAFLEAAAPGYLSDQQRSQAAPDWFEGALAYAQTVIKHTTSPLQPVPRTSGMGALPGMVRLADYLQEHGRQTRWMHVPPRSFWEAAASQLTEAADLLRLADSAQERSRLRYASTLYAAAAKSGSLPARVVLARSRARAGDHATAIRLARPAADQGHPGALALLALLHPDRSAALELAEGVAARSVLVSDRFVLGFLRQAGYAEHDPYDRVLAEPALPDSPRSREFRDKLLSLTSRSLLAGWTSGTLPAAEELAYEAAAAGAPFPLARIALLIKWKGDEETATRMYQLAVDAGHPGALGGLARIRQHSVHAYMTRGLDADGSVAAPWSWEDPDAPCARG
ncbi:sel1 repeat family protein [Streptomyces sp. NPDC102467]|uniref:sel1 repeat family protein n=1 Tax=Streptomyces sp. NPDC102467 TaxID=3366179 RepID=UPI0038023697